MMQFSKLGRLAAAAIVVAGLGATGAFADDASPEHLKAARATVAAINATRTFDTILPTIAGQLKAQLIQATPNFEPVITEIVDAKAIEIAARRADLEKEAAKVYAQTFTIEELNAITAFYTSPAGRKLIENGPIAQRELAKAADIWATGITRDLSKASTDAINAKLSAEEKNKAPQQ
ncbi:MAG: DUF2059 domain-containing protein [Rhizobiaceae bacterium]|nr:DUF2059 domain-containing protein [Rhizobiaceae bacterium]